MTSQNEAAARQFGPQAQAYVASSVHSAGPDLERLEAIARDMPAARVLDLGCGGGHAAYRIAPHVHEVVACDLSAEMLAAVAAEAARRGLTNITVELAAAERLPFSDDAFDFVACRLTAHHWGDLDAGLREVCRVLRAGGKAVVIDVVAPGLPAADTHLQAIELLRDTSHVRDYRMDEWMGALERAGLHILGAAKHWLPMEFASWVARMKTPEANVAAIRALQSGATAAVREILDIAEDGSFRIEVAMFELEARRAQA
ncbi:class I SAM-dependent methyltransferase [Sphingobium chungangianum]